MTDWSGPHDGYWRGDPKEIAEDMYDGKILEGGRQMILLEKLERKWKMHETLHQLKETLMRYGMDLTTPLSRIDKDYSRWNKCAFNITLTSFASSIEAITFKVTRLRQ